MQFVAQPRTYSTIFRFSYSSFWHVLLFDSSLARRGVEVDNQVLVLVSAVKVRISVINGSVATELQLLQLSVYIEFAHSTECNYLYLRLIRITYQCMVIIYSSLVQ